MLCDRTAFKIVVKLVECPREKWIFSWLRYFQKSDNDDRDGQDSVLYFGDFAVSEVPPSFSYFCRKAQREV